MVNLTVDGKPVQVPEGAMVLMAAKKAGARVPTLCDMKGINQIGACRVCVVEIEGEERLSAACNTPVSEGMAVLTNTPKVIQARRANVQMMLLLHSFALQRRAGNTGNRSSRFRP